MNQYFRVVQCLLLALVDLAVQMAQMDREVQLDLVDLLLQEGQIILTGLWGLLGLQDQVILEDQVVHSSQEVHQLQVSLHFLWAQLPQCCQVGLVDQLDLSLQ